MSQFKIAGIQMACDRSPAENISHAMRLVTNAASQGADVVCLPELFATPYFCQTEDPACFQLSESFHGSTVSSFLEIARELGITVIVPFFERRSAGIYHNSAAIVTPAPTSPDVYRKMHIPDDPGFYEKFYFTPGDLDFKAFTTPVGKIGVLICWDQWYPEAARITAMLGASVLFYPTAIGWDPDEKEDMGVAQHDAWRTVQRGHAVANGVYVAAINRVGFEPAPNSDGGIEFWGQSFICDPQGVILAEASADQEEIFLADVDLDHLERLRQMWPFWRDRRIDAYGALQKRWLDESGNS